MTQNVKLTLFLDIQVEILWQRLLYTSYRPKERLVFLLQVKGCK